MKKVKLLILCCSLLYIGAAKAQSLIKSVNLDLGLGVNSYMPRMADSLIEIDTTAAPTFNRNIMVRASINFNHKYSLQIGGNFITSQHLSTLRSSATITNQTYVENMNANILTLKLCNNILDSSIKQFSVYWNLGIMYLNSGYSFREMSPLPKDIINYPTNYLSNVGYEGAIGFRLNSTSIFGMFVEAGFNKLDDKMRAVIQGGISFYFK